MLYSGGSFGDFAFSETSWEPIDSSAFQAFLDEITSNRVWLLEVDGLSLASSGALGDVYSGMAFADLGFTDASAGFTGGVLSQLFASEGYITKGADLPAYTPYSARLDAARLQVERSTSGRSGIGGLVRVSASVPVVNADGALDRLLEAFAMDGRGVRIRVGRRDAALSSFGLVFTGVVADEPEIGFGQVLFRFSDGAAKLDVPLNQNVYGGTGGLDGGADLAGKPKPVCLGHVFNVPAPLVDSANLIYQVHDGAISDVPNVYDRGIALVRVAGAPAPGQYQPNVAQGTFKLGATPAGTVTADVLGDASLTGYINRTGDIILRVLVQRAALSSSEIDPTSFTNFNSQAPAEVGIWRGAEEASVADVVDELLANVGAWGGFSRYGAFGLGVVAAPAGTAAAAYTEREIRSITRLPRPEPVAPAVFRATVPYQRNYTVQSDLAAAVPIARTSFAAQAVRISKAEDLSIRSRHLLAVEYQQGTGLFAVQADSDTEAQRRFTLWSGRAAMFDVELPIGALTRDPGNVITLRHRRMGFSTAKDVRVLGTKLRGSAVTLTVLAAA